MSTPHSVLLPLAMCVARQHEGVHHFLLASSNTRRQSTGQHIDCEWEGMEEKGERDGREGGEEGGVCE